MEESTDFASPLEFVTFVNVTADEIAKFCQFLSDHFEFMSVGLWERLRSRLCSVVEMKSSNPRVPPQAVDRWKTIAFETGSPLNGIIAYLTTKCGSNVHDANVVTVTSSSVRSTGVRDAVCNVVATGTDRWFYPRAEPTQWICCDFHDARVRLTQYSILSCSGGAGPNWDNPQNWVLEGSVDGANWACLDRHNGYRGLDAKLATATFPVADSGEVRMLRLRQTGVNCAGHHELVLSRIEFFGTILEPNP
jgi:hypothetical protein